MEIYLTLCSVIMVSGTLAGIFLEGCDLFGQMGCTMLSQNFASLYGTLSQILTKPPRDTLFLGAISWWAEFGNCILR